MTTTEVDGTEGGLVIPEDDIRQAASWSPGSGELPLAIGDAFEIAIAWARANYAHYDDVRIRQISLAEYGCSTVSNRYYLLTLRR